MNITYEIVMKRLETLTANREKLQANINALSGAIDDCAYWLAILEEREPEDRKE